MIESRVSTNQVFSHPPSECATMPTMAHAGNGRRMSPGTEGPSVDYGWRFQGRTVGVLLDQSLNLSSPAGSNQRTSSTCLDKLTALQSCLQCGACTANCGLAGEEGLFPRRQMNLFQMGQHERLLTDPSVWHCYNCGDCSSRCPVGAKPGKLMGTLRQLAVERFAFPGFLAGLVGRPWHWAWVVAATAMLLLGAIFFGGSFSPATDRVRYASMLPHATLNVFFLTFTGLSLVSLFAGAVRAWNTYQGEPLRKAKPGILLRAFQEAIIEIMAHRRLADCAESRPRAYAHLAVFYGFVGLAGLAGVVALLLATGTSYPFPAVHPLKVLGNIAAGLLILGTAYFICHRWKEAVHGDASTFFDWMLLVNLLVAGVTGVLCEVFRYQNLAMVAYPVYFLHLMSVFVLLVFLPYSKLAHVGYRTVASTSRQYTALLAAEPTGNGVPRGLGWIAPVRGRLVLSASESA